MGEPGQLHTKDGTIEYSKIQIDDGGLKSDGMLFAIPRGEDGKGAKIIYIVDIRNSDDDCRLVRDKIKACMDGTLLCPSCSWPVEVHSPVIQYVDGVREGFECYCTFYKGNK